MSRIARKDKQLTPTSAENKADMPAIEHLALHEEASGPAASNAVRTTRVVFDVDATAAELESGVVVAIPNAASVFPVQEGQSRSKGLVVGAKVHSIYQDTGSSIRFDLNLHNTADERPAVDNAFGSLHTPEKTDMGMRLTAAEGQYTTMLNLTPYEKQRFAEGAAVYNPENVASNVMVQKYGNYNAESLYEGVIPFEGEQYYLVNKDHVVLNVIRQNWDTLGVQIEDENLFKGKYVQVAANTFDKVASELKQQVLAKMPFTDLNSLEGRFTSVGAVAAHPEGAEGKYKVVVELGLQYQVMPGQQLPEL